MTPADRVYEVIKGTVCTNRTLRDGRRQIAGFYFPGDVLGLEYVNNHPLAAQAITETRVRIIKKQALNTLASSDYKVADRLLALTARELARKQNLVLLLSRSAEERIIGFLLEMAQRASATDRIHLPMYRRHIADYLGLTLETVSRTFRNLERRGAIRIAKGSIVLCSQSANGKTEMMSDIFEAVKSCQPKTEHELDDWLVSLQARVA